MGIRLEKQYYMECDVCDDSYMGFAGDRNIAIEHFREEGWKIGKKCVCPDCQEASK